MKAKIQGSEITLEGSVSEIAEFFVKGVTRAKPVKVKKQKKKIVKCKRGRKCKSYTKLELMKAVKLKQEGKSIKFIARELGRTPIAIYAILKRIDRGDKKVILR